MIKLKITLLLLGWAASIQPVFSFNDPLTCEATREKPCIVQDTETPASPVGSLRDTLMISDYYHGNLAGVDSLRMSLSAEPGSQGWQQVADYIRSRAGIEPHQVLVLDLRQENHGYLNGNAITLCDLHNWLNLGKTAEESIATETQWLARLSSLKKIDNVLTVQQFAKKDYSTGNSIAVETLLSEKEQVTQTGFAYRRLPVTDHRAPLDKEVDTFVSLIKKLPKGMWLHVHCRGGKGRSTTLLAMYDMLNNADKASFNDIIERLASIPPYYDLTQIVRTDPDLTPYYQERLQFLQHFYEYAEARLKGYSGPWSQWKAEHQLV
ncbi:phosphatase domain-containing protein [Legionella taurinensis]|uniref:Tyrosine protein phosphatase n=1 Tax=Legionella taurinensis TaxID=70611 RepID=A0A3A5LBL7_9GAMM|nr:tyrosine protein phosphatase [Legionella taurinensis]RJT48731.1 tyrosine protein phosphatase [Legionella taurinensis]RJT69721.1 tyrosine protein phosphatase [Legionella taurinensis]STY24916.1 tyrosine phosphatase II superfamily protein [Legionella taurinensis]